MSVAKMAADRRDGILQSLDAVEVRVGVTVFGAFELAPFIW
jgi:hypothetical protein